MVRKQVKIADQIHSSKTSWVFDLFPKLRSDTRNEQLESDVDHEVKFYPSEFKRAEQGRPVTKFNYKVFTNNFSQFWDLLEPFLLTWSFFGRLKRWEYPMLSAFVLLVLLNLAYRDYISYIPALLFLTNVSVVILGRINPELLSRVKNFCEDHERETLNEEENKEVRTELKLEENNKKELEEDLSTSVKKRRKSISAIDKRDENVDQEKVAIVTKVECTDPSKKTTKTFINIAPPKVSTPKDSARTIEIRPDSPTSLSSVDGESTNGKKEELGFFEKLKRMQRRAISKLELAQNTLIMFNQRLMRIDGLYKWRNETASLKYLLYNLFLLTVCLLVPFRYLFAGLVIDQFTEKWQREGTVVGHIISEVPLAIPIEEED